jgi:hypothetical protein
MPYISDNEDTSSDEEEVVVPIEKPKATRKPRGPNKPKDVVEEIVNEVPLKEVKKPYKKKLLRKTPPRWSSNHYQLKKKEKNVNGPKKEKRRC